jgi:hypothetical protein
VAAAGEHVAYVAGGALLLDDTRVATFTKTRRFGGVTLDARHLAWTTRTYRPAGKGSLCLDRPYALAWAPVIEVRRLDAPNQGANAPHVSVPAGTETCKYED